MVYDGEGSGRPTHCPEPVVYVVNHRLAGGPAKPGVVV
jgi:hypothetical protein